MPIALVGDVVQSRRFADQVALLRALDGVLEEVNGRIADLHGPAQVRPLELVVRDQFRGTFAHLGAAAEAVVRLRLWSQDVVLATTQGEDEPLDVRVGLGHGPLARAEQDTVQQENRQQENRQQESRQQGGEPARALAQQTGAAWWCAERALEAAFELPDKAQWPPSLRTVYRSHDGRDDGAVNAWLLCQDQLFARMDLRDRRALRGLLDGERQVDVATDLGITQPAIARRLRDRGALAIKRGLEALAAAPTEAV